MRCPHCGKLVEIEKKESFQIHENEGGPPPVIPRGMSGEAKKKPLTPAEKQRAYRTRKKEEKADELLRKVEEDSALGKVK